jgi:hypothetical protein
LLWRKLVDHAGLAKPYRFDRLIVTLAAGLLLALLLTAAVTLSLQGQYISGTPREHYFIYVAALVILGFILARMPRLAAVALSLAAIDLGLGIGSFYLTDQSGRAGSLLPPQYRDPPRFQWHPLLQAVPIPSITRRVVHLTVSHSAEGTRGRDYAPAQLDGKTIIAVFGGSTTYDISVSDEETWPARLGALLGPREFAVINNGVPGYTSVEHVVQTAFYQDKFGAKPTCALYYLGWNDIRNARIPHLDPGYADFHLPSQIDALQVRRAGTNFNSLSPLLTLIVRIIGSAVDTARPARAIDTPIQAGNDAALEAIFTRNVRTISTINHSRNIRTIWVGQVLNAAAFQGDGADGWLPLLRNKDVLPLLRRFNDLLRREAAALGDVYIDVPDEAFEPSDFRDNGHFLSAGSSKFAALLAAPIGRTCPALH